MSALRFPLGTALVGLVLAGSACGSSSAPVAAGTAAPAATTAAAPTTTAAAVTSAVVATTAAATTPPSVAPSTTHGPTTVPATTSVVGKPSSRTALVVTPAALLGWWDGTKWVDSDATTPDIPSAKGAAFTVLHLGSAGTRATGGAVTATCDPIGAYTIELSPALESTDGPEPLAVNGTWNVTPRPVKVLAASAGQQYTALVSTALAAAGIPSAPVSITQVVTSDLDGDGTDEVLLTAQHPDATQSAPPEAGWYSMVLLVRTVAKTPTASVVISDVRQQKDPYDYPSMTIYSVQAVADLNGDGRSEIAVQDQEFEGAGTTIHELATDGSTDQVLTGGCGV